MSKESTPLELRLYDALRTIAKGYQSPTQLHRNAEREFGCDGADAIEMAYENIQQLAANAIKGVRLRRPKAGSDKS